MRFNKLVYKASSFSERFALRVLPEYFLIFSFSLRIAFICFVIQGEYFLLQVNVSCGIENINCKMISPVNQIDASFNQINTEIFIVPD